MSLREWISWLKDFIRERYVIVSLLVLCVFIFPDYLSPVFAIASLIAAAGEVRGKKPFFSVRGSGLLLLLFIADIALTVIYSISRISSLLTALLWLGMFSIYFALRAVITDSERFRRFMQLLTLCVGLLGLIACFQYLACEVFGADKKLLHFWCFLDEAVSKIYPLRSYQDDIRVASTFMNPNIFAEVMVALLPLCYYAVGKAKHAGTKNLFIICIIVGTIGTAFSFSRTGYFCIFVLMILTLIFITKRLSRHQSILLVTLFIISILLVFFTPNLFMDRIMRLHYGDASLQYHLLEWKNALEAISHRFLYGYGAGAGVSQAVMHSHGLDVLHSHNLILELLLEGGIPMLALYCAVVVKTLNNQIVYMYRWRKNNLLGFCLFSAIIMLMIFGFTDYPLLTPGLIGSFILIITLSDISMDLFMFSGS